MKKHLSSRFNADKLIKRSAWILLLLVIAVLSIVFGYWLGYDQGSEELVREREQNTELLRQIQEISQGEESKAVSKETRQEGEIRELRKQLQELLERERSKEALKPQHEYAPKDKTATPPPPHKRSPRVPGTEAKLAIIIDDVSYSRDVRAIESTGLLMTMSFLPPSPRHPDSAELAKGEGHYMVHLPLEALDYNHEEPNTLHVGDSVDTMAKRIEELKRLYPGVRYMNNHTGSKFTADSEAMERLIGILKQQGIQFVDSRTTAQTKAIEASEKYGVPYIGRDVFLDHKDGVDNVKKQIAEAVEKAKKYGTAIAIGHPRSDTLRALKESKAILGEVKLVRIDQL